MTTESTLRVQDGVVTATPADYPRAVSLIREDRLRGLWIRSDFLDAQPDAPVIDLSLLETIPFLEDFGIAGDIALRRIRHLDSVDSLQSLTKLALHAYPQLDVARFPKLEILFVHDGPRLEGLMHLRSLRELRVWGLRSSDLSFLSGVETLSELWITQARHDSLVGLETLGGLRRLEVSHCTKLTRFGEVPPRLTTLKFVKCSKLTDFSSLAGNASIELFFASKIASLAFVPAMRRIAYVGFETVVDGDLTPLLSTKTLRDAGFTDKRHHSHTLEEIKALLGRVRPEAGDERE